MRAAVQSAFEAVPRTAFLPASMRPHAHSDRPLPLIHGQTNSQPSTVAAMLELLDVQPGHKVLDLGSGSGWTTGLLAHLVGADGSVLGIERIADLALGARAALDATGPWPQATVRVSTPGVLGAPMDAPFDRILVSAEATHLPRGLVRQLRPDGVMVIPIAGVMTRVERRDGATHVTQHGLYVFVPLIEQ
ncbi:protein-L-isoaspartate O-methyltransferase family protein [Tessaracoccus antarcticus]|uniref:Protein-L-isoaspartate O-methyltransferase n=1 Tax=Tessaracoccus antarcticus TaxID=2479848 RepID=A0A3M0G0F2_9ACTN|nr:protein-L-isoaspartate carboxylmethyltransferase [Tessaracoccus antarcticus]RMB58404.1 protein-L-isoaspartate carboxylmethyltransferase [Tessaracoccus antarcticus]